MGCTKRNINAVSVLLEAGADPNIPDADGNTLLHYAVENYMNKDVLQAAINHGADVNVVNITNECALDLAFHIRNIAAVIVLLKAGANPNVPDADGDTLLHNAVHAHMSKEMLQIIIDHGADVNAVNNEGASALLLICGRGYKASVNELVRAGADTTGVLLACEREQRECVSALLRAGADPSIVDIYDDTCLHKVLTTEYDHETLQMLLDHGVPVNATNKNHQTAYMLACDKGNVDAMCALLNSGADPGFMFYVYAARHLST